MSDKNFEKGLVSICIPTYNGSDYICETVKNVLNQTYKNIEIIINDDMSSDDTFKKVSEFKDERIKVFQNSERLGLVGNWNETIKKAGGEYVKLLCQDDLLFAEAVEKQVQVLDSNEDVTAVIGNTSIIDSDGNEIMKRMRFKHDVIKNGSKYAKKSLRGRNIYAEPANIMYRTYLFYMLNGYDNELKYTPDWDFSIRVSYLGNIFCTNEMIMSFRISSDSETSRLYAKKSHELIDDTDLLIEKHKNLNCIKITVIDKLLFKFVIRAFSLLRSIFLALKN